jgi:hypothetical protein
VFTKYALPLLSLSSIYLCFPLPNNCFLTFTCDPTIHLLSLLFSFINLCHNHSSPRPIRSPVIPLFTSAVPQPFFSSLCWFLNHPSPHTIISQPSLSSHYLCPNHPSPHTTCVTTIPLLTLVVSQPSFSSHYLCHNHPSTYTTCIPTIPLLTLLVSQPSLSSHYLYPNHPSPHTTCVTTIPLLTLLVSQPLLLTCAPTMPLRSLGRSVCDQLLIAQG